MKKHSWKLHLPLTFILITSITGSFQLTQGSHYNKNTILDALLKDQEKLALQDSDISTLDADSFVQLPNIREIDLCKNNLQTLPDDLLTHQPSLKSLSVCHNKLVRLSSKLFRNKRSLSHLKFNDNLIEVLDEGVFDRLYNLEYLSLEWNQIKSLPANIFRSSSLENLCKKKLIVSFDRIVRILCKCILRIVSVWNLSGPVRFDPVGGEVLVEDVAQFLQT